MEKSKLSIPAIKEKKQQAQKLRMLTAYDYLMATAIDKTSVEMILVGDSLGMVVLGYDSTIPVTMEDMIHHTKPVVRGAPRTFIITDMPFGSYNTSIPDAIANANRIMKEGGADAVKLEGGTAVADTVRAMVNAGIPVMGHIGLTPQTATQLGGMRVQGKDLEAMEKLLDDAQCLEEAGAFALVVECVPSPVAKKLTERLGIPVIGIGAGPDCDGQVLVTQDLLGMFDRFTPKFVKQYAQLNGTIQNAIQQYADEVGSGSFPAAEHSFAMKTNEVLKRLY